MEAISFDFSQDTNNGRLFYFCTIVRQFNYGPQRFLQMMLVRPSVSKFHETMYIFAYYCIGHNRGHYEFDLAN